ncbi:hypothetical protein Gotri_024745 [Gossypium trilobum]|uniref:Methyltransferase n=1 Tax=Gossypium trilobum TaxID=34281 RepID=A0A7J9DNR5_9ROSI|nr:hypothetical protein [Gossypium trilobum]
MLKRNILAMSFAPRDNHEAQVQFALERRVPAVIGVLGSSRALDMPRRSRCLIPWTSNGKCFEAWWILGSINWKTYYKTWKRSKEDLNAEQRKMEELAELVCWEKKYEKGDIAIWRKRVNYKSCRRKSINMCKPRTQKMMHGEFSIVIVILSYLAFRYMKMVTCITPFPKVSSASKVACGKLEKFPARPFAVGLVESYQEDNKLSKKHVNAYKWIHKLIGTTRYRNVMDMNAGLGGFAATPESPKQWVMNVVPTIAKMCEGFSTYPRTYDLIHANGVFSLYENKCKFEDIHLEMDRTLRSEGAVIFRDDVDVINKVSSIAKGMRWDIKMVDDEDEDGPPVTEKILVRLNSTGSVATEETVLSMTNKPFQQVILFTSKEITKFRPRYQPVIKVGK